ncbi:MAG: VWA domain-containing protein [Akkermansiaceae bacterium]|nr:VWA domain-containing protein [Akkermansiaceae bacterium]
MTLAHPGWFFLLLLLPIMAVVAVAIALRGRSRWDRFAAPRLRGALIRRSGMFPRWLSLFFLLAGCAALIGTLARPQGDVGTKIEKTRGRNILIALDLSRSMRVDDVSPDRLGQAKIVIYELLEKLPNDRIGLIGFAGTAHEYAPLTVDHKAVAETVGQIDETWAPVGGSDLTAALKLSIQILKKTGQKNNALVILSDGEENENEAQLNAMIQEAESSGVYIHTIGVGTPQGGYVPNPDSRMGQVEENGRPVVSKLQPDVMRKLAEETGGKFVIANGGTNIPAMVEAATRDLDSFEMKGRERRILVEFFQWLLLPAILFLMISIISGTRWRGLRTALVLMGAFFIVQPEARASEATEAKKALEEREYQKAKDGYHRLADDSKLEGTKARYRIGEGVAAYRNGDYREARSAFSGAMMTDDPKVASSAHFGMANTLFQLGWQGLADESYPAEPEDVPDLDRFETLVKERLAKMKQSDEESAGRSEDFIRMNSLMMNWTDAVRHYDSATRLDATNKGAVQNRDTTMIYLRKLQELLDEEKKDADKSMPQQGQGQGQRQPGQGEGGEGEEGQGGKGDQDRPGGEGDEKDDRNGDGGDEKKEESKSKGAGDPNESPEDKARRLLSENADLEKGPLSQGRVDQRPPKKDW